MDKPVLVLAGENRAAMMAAIEAEMLRAEQPRGEVIVALRPEPPTVTIDIRKDGFDDLMGGPSQAKPPKTYHVPGGGARERARRLAKMNPTT